MCGACFWLKLLSYPVHFAVMLEQLGKSMEKFFGGRRLLPNPLTGSPAEAKLREESNDAEATSSTDQMSFVGNEVGKAMSAFAKEVDSRFVAAEKANDARAQETKWLMAELKTLKEEFADLKSQGLPVPDSEDRFTQLNADLAKVQADISKDHLGFQSAGSAAGSSCPSETLSELAPSSLRLA